MPHYKAVDQAARSFATQHGNSETGAKRLMAKAFEAAEGRSFYTFCKALEKELHIPVREAQGEIRKVERRETGRTGPSR